jgi:hypothetical protein
MGAFDAQEFSTALSAEDKTNPEKTLSTCAAIGVDATSKGRSSNKQAIKEAEFLFIVLPCICLWGSEQITFLIYQIRQGSSWIVLVLLELKLHCRLATSFWRKCPKKNYRRRILDPNVPFSPSKTYWTEG